MEAFDVHTSIVYSDIARLYWGKYPFKVVMSHGVVLSKPEPKPQWRMKLWGKSFVVKERRPRKPKALTPIEQMLADVESRTSFAGQTKAVRDRWLGTLVDESTEWKITDNGRKSMSFFFVDPDAAKRFIDRNLDDVREVWRPAGTSDLEWMQAQPKRKVKPEVRDCLYWGRYRFKIDFKRPMNDDRLKELHEWFDQYYKNKDAINKALLSGDTTPRLYLNSDADLIFTKLGINHLINTISEAILRENIHEHQSGT